MKKIKGYLQVDKKQIKNFPMYSTVITIPFLELFKEAEGYWSMKIVSASENTRETILLQNDKKNIIKWYSSLQIWKEIENEEVFLKLM